MKWNKEVSLGCLFLIVAFALVGFILPWAISFGVISDNSSERVFAWTLLGILLLIALFAYPNFFVYCAVAIVLAYVAYSVLGEPSGACVPKFAGDCA
jgi:hypothetical protein